LRRNSTTGLAAEHDTQQKSRADGAEHCFERIGADVFLAVVLEGARAGTRFATELLSLAAEFLRLGFGRGAKFPRLRFRRGPQIFRCVFQVLLRLIDSFLQVRLRRAGCLLRMRLGTFEGALRFVGLVGLVGSVLVRHDVLLVVGAEMPPGCGMIRR
jgi:hypothetical protein